jgi:hypothetical protein
MSFRIDYYLHDKKVADSDAPFSIEKAVYTARNGLHRHKAHYAKIVDPNRPTKVVELVHRDVLR